MKTGKNPIAVATDMISRNLVVGDMANFLEKHIQNATGDKHFQMPFVRRIGIRDGQIPKLAMDRAQRKPISSITSGEILSFTKAQFANLARQSNHAQIVDYLTGQQDRHSGNAIFDGNNLRMVDDDACLTCDRVSETGERQLPNDFLPKPLPEWIDQAMADAVLALTPDALEEIMRNNGRNPDIYPFNRELALMCERLLTLQDHVHVLSIAGRVIKTPEGWNDQGVMDTCSLGHSYIAHYVDRLFPKDSLAEYEDRSMVGLIYEMLNESKSEK